MIDLSSQVAVVTGAGSQHGIGKAIAAALARQGATVVVADIDQDGAENVAATISASGGMAVARQLDVTDENMVQTLFNQVVRDFGSVEILVNNAGITQPIPVKDMSLSDWERIMGVNATGTFLCSRAASTHMENQNYGRIVNISSVSAKRGGGIFGGAHYSAAKAAILGFGKALAREVASSGITVNAVAPGLILTDIRGGVESETEQKRLSSNIPIPRVGLPEEVADVVCFLVSKEAGYITGEEVDINGGAHID